MTRRQLQGRLGHDKGAAAAAAAGKSRVDSVGLAVEAQLVSVVFFFFFWLVTFFPAQQQNPHRKKGHFANLVR